MLVVEEVRGYALSQPCPACDGLMPADAIAIGAWEREADELGRPVNRRTVSMCCPHCDHAEDRQQVVPLF